MRPAASGFNVPCAKWGEGGEKGGAGKRRGFDTCVKKSRAKCTCQCEALLVCAYGARNTRLRHAKCAYACAYVCVVWIYARVRMCCVCVCACVCVCVCVCA